MPNKVGVPSVGGLKDSLVDFGLGAGGALVYGLSTQLLGSGLFGGLAGAMLAGSTIKGTRGTVIATVLGFQSILGSLTSGGASAAQTDVGDM